MEEVYEWDVFLSHASEDKNSLVRDLANELTKFGLRIWYDEFSLKVGDSLSGSINEGLSKSEFGLVVLSHTFFTKKWTDYELRGLTSLEVQTEKIVLPILHEISPKEVAEKNPTLSDKLAFVSEGKTVADLAVEIIERVKPDLFQSIQRRKAHIRLVENAELQVIELSKLKMSPRRRDKLDFDSSQRSRAIFNAIRDVYSISYDDWIDGFLRDLNYTNELRIWERMANVFSEYCTKYKVQKKRKRKEVFRKIMIGFMFGINRKALEDYFSEYGVNFLLDSWASEEPLQRKI